MLEQGWAEMSWVPALRGRAGTWPCTIPKCDFWRAWGELPPSSFVSAVIIYESTSVLKTLKWTFFKPFLCQNHIPECTKNFYLFFFFWSFVFQWVSDSSFPSFLLTILSFVCSSYKMNLWCCFMQSVARWWLDKKQPDLPQRGTKLPQLLLRDSIPFWMKHGLWGSQ